MENYIDRIKSLKSKKKITNQQLADLTGIPIGTLSKMLAGMNESPKISTIVSICNALDASVEYVVTGVPENTNNYTLDASEIRFMEDYRKLGAWDKEVMETLLHKMLEKEPAAPVQPTADPAYRIIRPEKRAGRFAGEVARSGKRQINLYELPVSAGPGVYLEDAGIETISIPNQNKTADADYALRISGNSMEPKYHNGDILLVQSTDSVEIGEPGIFLLDGNGFFKLYGGDRLISLNPEYGPILLKDFADIQCKGRVVGRLRRK